MRTTNAAMLLSIGLGALVLGGLPRPARACGGTFCDNGPNAMPVPQTGENILFVRDGGFIEAHIQIAYDPEAAAEQFAWVVPVMNLPELSVGSQSLFSSLATNTAPSYGSTTWREDCFDPSDDEPSDPCAEDSGDDGDGGFTLDVGGTAPPGEPEVVLHEVVGAFEMFVLDGGDAQGVMTWLDANGFAQDDAATPIVSDYLEQEFMFVAFKLAPNTEASEIHPVTLRYEGEAPCVPIKLTQIAAVDDMVIRTYFLGDARTVPSNYQHVELNPLKLDFLQFADNYLEAVSMAVDEAGGHAWVTEYAGASDIVPADSIAETLWQPSHLLGLSAVEALIEMRQQQWLACSSECAWVNPLVESLLLEQLVLPDDVEPAEVWACPECFEAELAKSPWSAADFVEALDERVIIPAERARELLSAYPMLTRMVTTLSPHEMTEDPLFVENPDLGVFDQLQQIGQNNLFCDGPSSYSMPDGRLVAIPNGTWPAIEPDQMPWAARIEQLTDAGAPQVTTDNAELIAGLLDRFNEMHGPRAPVQTACGEDTGGASDDFGDDQSIPPDGLSAGSSEDRDDDSGCSCSSGGSPAGWAWALGALVLGCVVRRRQRG